MWAPEHTSKCHKFIWILIYFDEHITGGHTGPPLQIYVLFIICSLIQNPCSFFHVFWVKLILFETKMSRGENRIKFLFISKHFGDGTLWHFKRVYYIGVRQGNKSADCRSKGFAADDNSGISKAAQKKGKIKCLTLTQTSAMPNRV